MQDSVVFCVSGLRAVRNTIRNNARVVSNGFPKCAVCQTPSVQMGGATLRAVSRTPGKGRNSCNNAVYNTRLSQQQQKQIQKCITVGIIEKSIDTKKSSSAAASTLNIFIIIIIIIIILLLLILRSSSLLFIIIILFQYNNMTLYLCSISTKKVYFTKNLIVKYQNANRLNSQDNNTRTEVELRALINTNNRNVDK